MSTREIDLLQNADVARLLIVTARSRIRDKINILSMQPCRALATGIQMAYDPVWNGALLRGSFPTLSNSWIGIMPYLIRRRFLMPPSRQTLKKPNIGSKRIGMPYMRASVHRSWPLVAL